MSHTRAKDRRLPAERRASGERRKGSEGRCAIVEVCRSMLHLALVAKGAGGEGQDRIVTRSLRWRKETTSLHTEQGEAELTQAFSTLVSEERLAGSRLRVVLGGEFCVTRVITGQTDEVRREYSELEERSLRYLTLGPGPKVLAGHMQPLDARHQHALLAVANERTLELLMRVADKVGVQIESIEPSLLALSRAQAHLRDTCQDACLIIQLSESVAELGVSHKGRLLLDYRPGGQTTAENVAEVVAQHLSRLQRYVERYHSYLDAPLKHVYLTGDAEAVQVALKSFKKLKQFEVHILEPGALEMPWQHAEAVPGTPLAAALGTAIGLYPAATAEQGPNLIESILSQRREPMRPILIRCLAPVAAVLLVAAGLLALHAKQWHETRSLRAELEELTPSVAKATELQLRLMSSEAKLKQLDALAGGLPDTNWQQVLDRIRQSTPNDVWLDRLSFHDGHSAALSGASYSDEGVYDFVGHLKEVPNIAEIALEGTGVGQSTTGPTTSFNLQITLADLAGRGEKEVQP